MQPPVFNCPPINFEQEHEDNWSVLAKVVLEEPQLVRIAMENKKEPLYNFTGRKEYIERKKQLANEMLKQKDTENDQSLKKIGTSKKARGSEMVGTSHPSTAQMSTKRKRSLLSPKTKSNKKNRYKNRIRKIVLEKTGRSRRSQSPEKKIKGI